MDPVLLYVDDEKGNVETFDYAFSEEVPIVSCQSGEVALKLAEDREVAVLIADQKMPGMTGIELCERFLKSHPDTIRIILTAFTDTKILLDAIRRGHVHDYIVKPWKKSDLKPVLEKWREEYRQKKLRLNELEAAVLKSRCLEEQVSEIYDEKGMVGTQSGLQSVMQVLSKAAPSDATILILGETGTGKELMARAVHVESKRSRGPFIPVHCAALAQNLLEDELFGHERGAFTGANQRRLGRFEMAKGGTIFLDEVGEIPESIQVKLLRVLQEREIQRLGGNQSISVDIRVLAATHRDLSRDVENGRFREDLFYRLNVINVRVPPLRERTQDIPMLAEHFAKKFSGKNGREIALSSEAKEYLKRYDWPGNVRELENIIERAVILNAGGAIEPEDFDLRVDEMQAIHSVNLESVQAGAPLMQKIKDAEIKDLSEALVKCKGNISEAARQLGIPRTNLFRRLRKYRLI